MKQKSIKKVIIRVVVIAAIIIIPLLYSYLYLGAFWDPYSRLESLPVAVVNNDAGAVINGEERNVGQEMCDELEESAELKFVFTDENTAKEGTLSDSYYAMVIIPEDFSEDIASASTTDKHTATITFSSNEKRNYLASQILSRAVLQIEESIRCTVDAEIIDQLADKMNEVPDQMTELQDGLAQLQDGSTQLAEGSSTLADGTQTYQEKFLEYKDGITSLKNGSDTLTAGAGSLNSGISELLAGANKLAASTEDIDQLTTGAQSLAAGATQLEDGINQYTTGVDALISSVSSTSAFLTQYVTKVNPAIMKDPVFAGFISKMSDPANAQSIATLQAASASLKQAAEQIADGSAQLSAGSANLPQLKAALATLSEGLTKAQSGSAELANGAQALADGLNTVNDATTQLSDGAADIAQGAADVNEGMIKLDEGINTAADGVDTAITDTNDQLAALEGLADYAEAPVTVETTPITAVPNYGTAFAPYFLSLSLWVGALIMFVGIYMDAEGKFRILTSASEHKMARSFIYLLIGFAQALVLAFVLQYSLGLEVSDPLKYYAACCLVSMVFIAIVQFLMVHLKDVGKFLSIVLLILQLTSCGGTFPMETVPKLFNVLYPYMPMTYSVGLFKEVISGATGNEAAKNIGVLIGILIAFMALTLLLSGIKAKKAVKAKNEVVLEG